MEAKLNNHIHYPAALVNVNGVISNSTDAKISVFDRGFLYGDSIYEVFYSENGSFIFLDEHIERLYHSAYLLDLQFSWTKEQIVAQILRTASESKIKDAYMRLVVTRGVGALTLDPGQSVGNNYVYIIDNKPVYPSNLYDQGVHLFISKVLKTDKRSVNPEAKSGNYLNNVMAMHEAKKQGADDALLVNSRNEITEGTTFNLWMSKENKVLTPAITSGLLQGITRQKVIEICQKENINFEETIIKPSQLLEADEVFITSSTRGIMPVGRINDTIYTKHKESGSATKKIASLYKKLLTKEQSKGKYKYE